MYFALYGKTIMSHLGHLWNFQVQCPYQSITALKEPLSQVSISGYLQPGPAHPGQRQYLS